MEERLWVARALQGDRSAKAHLLEETIQPIYYLCWKLTGSTVQAGELTRRTFARAFSSLLELRPDAAFDRFVTAIAVNLCRQSLKQSQPALFTTDEREMAYLKNTYLAPEECLPRECLSQPELQSRALCTISLLPPEQRVCMFLCYVAMLKPRQIAGLMEVDEVTVLGRLNSGRYALRMQLPSAEPQAILTQLFAKECASVPVPELLHTSCMQTVLSTEPMIQEPEEIPEEDDEVTEPEKKGIFAQIAQLPPKQRYLLYGGVGVAAFLVLLLLILLLRGCNTKEPEPEISTEPAPMEEIDENLESATRLQEYGVEMLLTLNRRDAEAQISEWQSVLPDYVSSGIVEDLALTIQTDNDAVSQVELSLASTDLDITRLKGLDMGSSPLLGPTAEAIRSEYQLACYENAPLFDPTPRSSHSMAAYSENYRYELVDTNEDGRAEFLRITRTGAGFDPETGTFRPYGETVTDLLGLKREDAELLLGEGHYGEDDVALYAMTKSGALSDDTTVEFTGLMEARTDMDAARQRVSAITIHSSGSFFELIPELSLPDARLTLEQLQRKLSGGRGHLGQLEGDVFAPLFANAGTKTLIYYEGVTRYIFCAGEDGTVNAVELRDLSDCRLWDAGDTEFRKDDTDLEKLLGMTKYAAYESYGILAYPTYDFSATALGLWETDGIIRTVYNGADPRPVMTIHRGDSRSSVEALVEKKDGYCYAEENNVSKYVVPEKRELVVTYEGDTVKILQLEDHSQQASYKAPEKKKADPKTLFAEFLTGISDGKASWYGDLTHDGTGDLLLCRPSGSGCLVQLYVLDEDGVCKTPIYSQSISASAGTDAYIVNYDNGPCLLLYSLTESATTRHCSWRLFSINGSGGEVILETDEASVNLLDMLLTGQEEYDKVKERADALRQQGTYLCGTQTGTADFSKQQANLQ